MDGRASGAGMIIAGVDSFYGNGVPDPMYGVYLVNANRAITVTITNLIAGDFDFYLYGHGSVNGQNGVFQLTTGSLSYGPLGTTTGSGWDSTVWQEGAQYVEFTNVIVAAGQTVTVTADPGSSGYSMIAGLQIAVSGSGTPQITAPAASVASVAQVEMSVGSSVVQAGQSACVPVTVLTSVGLTNLSFTLTSPAGLLKNWSVNSTNSAIKSVIVGNAASQPQFVFSVQSGQVPQGSSVIGSICLDTAPGDSAFVPLVVTHLCAMQADSSAATNLVAQNGRVTVIGSQPLLDAALDTNLNPMLTLYGSPGVSYTLLSTTNLMERGSWSTAGHFTLTGLFQGISLTGATNRMQFFRAVQP